MKHVQPLAVAGIALLFLFGALFNTQCGYVETPEPNETITDRTSAPTAKKRDLTKDNFPIIDGSTSTLPMHAAIVAAFFPESGASGETLPLQHSKTVPSYHRLIDGEVDLILVPYASEAVRNYAKEANVELEFARVAAEALIFITPIENTVDNITREAVRQIYLNYGIKNWSELGGADRELVPLCRNADSGSQSQLDNLVLQNEPMHPDIEKNYVELTMDGMLTLTAFYHNGGIGGEPTNSYALGYTLYSYLQMEDRMTGIADQLKILAFDGVEATEETILDETYPLADGYYAVVRHDLPEDHPARMVQAWLMSEDGQRAIERYGFMPGHDDDRKRLD